MELHNDTPFHVLDFGSVDNRGQPFHVVVLRSTFEVSDDGVLRLAEEPSPLVMADELYGNVGSSSVKQESDLAPFKPKCDVVVLGDAIAPGEKPARRFQTGITLRRKGNILLDKRVMVTGPRYWKQPVIPLSPWKLTEPEPIQSLPMRYEYAYGGECRVNQGDSATKRVARKYLLKPEQRAEHPEGNAKAPVAHTCFGANTVGKGYMERWYLNAKRLSRVPAPQIESLNDPIKTLGKSYTPQGFGILAKACASRISFAGKMDDAFIKSGKSLPEDFDFAFWNGVPADMQIPWLEGTEEVKLTNMGIPQAFVLPEHKICAEVIYRDRQMAGLDFNCDTLIINTEQKTVSLVYRLKLLLTPEIQSLNVQRLSVKERDILLEHVRSVNRQVYPRATDSLIGAGQTSSASSSAPQVPSLNGREVFR